MLAYQGLKAIRDGCSSAYNWLPMRPIFRVRLKREPCGEKDYRLDCAGLRHK